MGRLVSPVGFDAADVDSQPPFMEALGLVKRFGGVAALKGVDLSLEQGEVHALVGENGAGKSTLGKCLAGVLHPDEGELRLCGNIVDYRSPRKALSDGITIVEQELALVPAMSVADNVLLGRRPTEGQRAARRGAAHAAVRQLNEKFVLGLNVDRLVEELSVAEQQKVEILRALAREARLIVMDEPTARLAKDEATNLMRIIRLLAAEGRTIVYVSHFLPEVLEVSDRVTVLRDGAIVRTAAAARETPATLVHSMLGRSAALGFPEKRYPQPSAPAVLAVRDLADGARVAGVSFNVRQGEIVGLGGLVGSGRSEVARLIFGAERPSSGSIEIAGAAGPIKSVRDAVQNGVAYLPESRKDLGLFLERSNQENITLSHLDRITRFGVISRPTEKREARKVLKELSVKPAHAAQAVGSLSGGNQQRVLFGKWLWQTPRLFIADEPTRGVDVGAKFEIYKLLVDLAERGLAILLISSEIEELVGLSHRVVILARGSSVSSLSGDEVTEDAVLRAAFNSDAVNREASPA